MKTKIVILFARHGTVKYPNALDALERIYTRKFPDVDRETLIIDSALDEAYCEARKDGVLLGSSNDAWEFSSWDSAISFLGARLLAFDFVHLVTSAFETLYIGYIERFDQRMLAGLETRAAALGHIDCYNQPVQLLGCMSQSWLRSSFVLLPVAEVRLLGSFVSIKDKAAFFSGSPRQPFRQDAPLSADYQANIIGWLTGAGTGQGTVWHSRFDLDELTLPFFEAKTLAILNEHALSLRLRTRGCATVDTTWLATRMSKQFLQRNTLGAIPNWRVQLANRDEVAQAIT